MVSSLANQDLRQALEAGTCLVTPDWFVLFGYLLSRTMVPSLTNQDLNREQEGGTYNRAWLLLTALFLLVIPYPKPCFPLWPMRNQSEGTKRARDWLPLIGLI